MFSVKQLDRTVEQAEQAVGADTILKVLGPMIEARVEFLIRSIISAPTSDLPEMRGQLCEVWRILTELRRLAGGKATVDEAVNQMFATA